MISVRAAWVGNSSPAAGDTEDHVDMAPLSRLSKLAFQERDKTKLGMVSSVLKQPSGRHSARGVGCIL